ncbi:MAG: hypothetical protein WCH60_05340 [Burkholderiales bacterium]
MEQTDLAHWLTVLLVHGLNGQTYKMGSPDAFSMAALADRVRRVVTPGKAVHIARPWPSAPASLYPGRRQVLAGTQHYPA